MKRLLIFSIILSTIFHQTACTNTKAESREEVKKLPVITLKEKDTTFNISYVADIQACRNVEIHSRLSGLLEHIAVDEGQSVKKGQLLFRINTDELQIELRKAEAAANSAHADVKVAQLELERIKALVDKKIVAQSEADLAEAKLNAIRAKAQEARAAREAVSKRISYASVYAPFDGVIDRLPLKQGSMLSEGSLLTTISDLSCMWAYFNISENEYLKLQAKPHSPEQDEIQLMLADGSLYPYKGKIKSAESEIDAGTGSIAFRADFPNPGALLKHGASGSLIIKKPMKQVLLVPQKSVVEIQDKNYVYVVDKDQRLRMQNFVPLQRIDAYYIVGSGLSANDRILYEGVQSAKDGQKVNPIQQ